MSKQPSVVVTIPYIINENHHHGNITTSIDNDGIFDVPFGNLIYHKVYTTLQSPNHSIQYKCSALQYLLYYTLQNELHSIECSEHNELIDTIIQQSIQPSIDIDLQVSLTNVISHLSHIHSHCTDILINQHIVQQYIIYLQSYTDMKFNISSHSLINIINTIQHCITCNINRSGIYELSDSANINILVQLIEYCITKNQYNVIENLIKCVISVLRNEKIYKLCIDNNIIQLTKKLMSRVTTQSITYQSVLCQLITCLSVHQIGKQQLHECHVVQYMLPLLCTADEHILQSVIHSLMQCTSYVPCKLLLVNNINTCKQLYMLIQQYHTLHTVTLSYLLQTIGNLAESQQFRLSSEFSTINIHQLIQSISNESNDILLQQCARRTLDKLQWKP